MAEIGFGFHQLFAEQQAAFRLRLGNLVPTWAWDDLRHNQHDRAFVVAGATKADLLADLAAAVDRAISQGTTLEEFRRDFRRIVAQRGWTGWTGEGSEKGEAWRTRVIYRTNMLTSYAAGRHAQLLAGKYKYWVYRHSGAEHPRLHHLALDGLALPPDHPFWAKFFPPNGWGCGCRVFGANTAAGIRRMGGDPDKQLPPDWDRPDPRTGLPKGLQKGWDYAPGASTAQLIADMTRKAEKMPSPLGDDLVSHITPPRRPEARLRYDQIPETVADLAEISSMARRSGMTLTTGHSGLDPAGYLDLVRVGVEAVQRFDLPPLMYFGSIADAPFVPNWKVPEASAAYHWRSRSLLFPPSSTDHVHIATLYSAGVDDLGLDDFTMQMERASDEVRALAARSMYPGWSVIRTVSDVAAHEFAHHFHNAHRAEVDALMAHHHMEEEGWALLVSHYATQEPMEFFAESFALYLRRPDEEHYRLHPALLDFLSRHDRRRG